MNQWQLGDEVRRRYPQFKETWYGTLTYLPLDLARQYSQVRWEAYKKDGDQHHNRWAGGPTQRVKLNTLAYGWEVE